MHALKCFSELKERTSILKIACHIAWMCKERVVGKLTQRCPIIGITYVYKFMCMCTIYIFLFMNIELSSRYPKSPTEPPRRDCWLQLTLRRNPEDERRIEERKIKKFRFFPSWVLGGVFQDFWTFQSFHPYFVKDFQYFPIFSCQILKLVLEATLWRCGLVWWFGSLGTFFV